MFFSAIDYFGKPVSNEDIRQDIQKEYLDKTLTVETFPFIENTSMSTVHPCKHANVLKSMADAMRENKQKVDAHFALLIFLKFITSVIPTVEFDITGDLIFE
jgi:ubiquitin-like-conjugating enzyme ATG3